MLPVEKQCYNKRFSTEKRQAITWSSVGPVRWRIYKSLRLSV